MSRLRRALRSAGALALVVGFYVLAVALLSGYAVFGVVMSQVVFDPGGTVGLPLVLAQISFIVAALAMLPQLVSLGRGAGPRPGTAALDLDDAFGLWETVMDLADRIGVPAPTEIRLTLEANAAVSEEAGGRRGTWERRLYVGLPLLAGLRADELRAVLAHELAHCAQGHTRFAATVYRGATGLDRARERFAKPEAGNPIVTVYAGFQYLTLSLYAWIYNALSFAVRRRQELEADATAAAVGGRDAAVRALVSVGMVAAAWQDFHTQVLRPMAVLGRLPDDPVRAFNAVLTDPRYGGQAATGRRAARGARHPEVVRHPFDSHPPLQQRLDALRALPEGRAVPDARPAHALVADERPLPRRVLAVMMPPRPHGGECLTRPWPDWLAEVAEARAVRAVEELDAAVGLIALARPTTGGVLDLLTGSRGGELSDALRDTGWGERWEAAPRPPSPQGAEPEEDLRADGSWWVRHMTDRWQERGETPSGDDGRPGPDVVEEEREADTRRALLALELLAGHVLVAAGRSGWAFRLYGPGRPVPEDPAAAEALELVPAALADPAAAARLRALLLRCGVSLETELRATGPDAALSLPPESTAQERDGRPAPVFRGAVFLMALVALLLFALRWDLENERRSRPPLPSLPDRAPLHGPVFLPTCPPGYLPYGDLCVRIPQPQPTG
ncbi:M48 family metalloprotease [Streptomyces griseoincarnatus]